MLYREDWSKQPLGTGSSDPLPYIKKVIHSGLAYIHISSYKRNSIPQRSY